MVTALTPPLPRRRFIAGAAAIGALSAWPAAAQFRIEISGVGATQLPIVVADFRGEAAAGTAVAAIVRADLQRSGVFRATPADVALDERSEIDGRVWRERGADALVAGSVTRLADGRFDVRFRLWDVVKGEQLLGQSKLVLGPDLRLAAHRVADDITLKLTGERGVNATRIAYVVKTGSRYTLHITDADGEGGQVALASNDPLISPAWSPDGRQLAYVSFESQKAVVWVQDLTTGQRRMVANFRGSNSAPAWSPDGRELALALSRGGSTQIFTMPASGGAVQQLTRSASIDTEPVYAPDGRSLYFVSDRGGGPQIYRVAKGGGNNVERITFNGNYNISPTISPDGRTLAFISRPDSAYRLMTQELDSGTVRPLTDTQDDESPSFAPNGRLLVYSTRQRGADVLMTTTLDGKIKTRLLSSGADMREPAWGPYAAGGG
jgi:TolB protein